MVTKQINFSSEWGGKIYKERFTTIRWNDYPIKQGEVLPISLKGTACGLVAVEQTRFVRACDIPTSLLREDLGRPATDDDVAVKQYFLDLLHRFYSRKKDWKGMNSIVLLLFLKKVNVSILD